MKQNTVELPQDLRIVTCNTKKHTHACTQHTCTHSPHPPQRPLSRGYHEELQIFPENLQLSLGQQSNKRQLHISKFRFLFCSFFPTGTQKAQDFLSKRIKVCMQLFCTTSYFAFSIQRRNKEKCLVHVCLKYRKILPM